MIDPGPAEQIVQLTRKVDELTQRRTAFVAAAAHELKTPLTVLQVYLETLRDDLADGMSDEQKAFIGVCHESVLRLRRLVEDLVELAALDSGKLAFDTAAVDLEPLLAEVVADTQPLAARAGVALRLAVTGSPAARGDAARLQQVVRNLIENAVKFTRPGGEVTVRAARSGDAVEVAVADTGIGIPIDRREAIFGEFVRFSPEGGAPGSGLGLSICRRLVAAMGGEIAVDSEEGKGSTFTVRLPGWTGG